VRELCASAVEAALAAGASYADARAVVRRSQAIATKNGRVDDLSDVESEGIGVRVLVGGAWGFAADGRLDPASARETAERACGFAQAAPGAHDRMLSPVEPQQGSFRTEVLRDPFEVSPSDKVDLCLRAEAALKHRGVTVRQAAVRAQRELKLFLSSDGSEIEQELVECGGGIDAIAVGDGLYQTRSYPSAHVGSSARRRAWASRPPRCSRPSPAPRGSRRW
jgi:TldD protein